MWKILTAIAISGGVGGLLNALVSGASLGLPQLVNVEGSHVIVPGFVGNIVVGSAAAFVSFALYGPMAVVALIRVGPKNGASTEPPAALTLAAIAGAILVGFSGGRWLSAEVDKSLAQATAQVTAEAAEGLARSGRPTVARPPNPEETKLVIDALRSIRAASPLEAYREAVELRTSLERRAGGP